MNTTIRELRKSEETLLMLTKGCFFRPAFASRLKKATKNVREALEDFHEQHLTILQANGAEKVAMPPSPGNPQGSSTYQIVQGENETDEAYKARGDASESQFKELLDMEIEVGQNKIPVGDFSSNFVSYLNPQLKGQPLGLSVDDLDVLEWLIIEKADKKADKKPELKAVKE